MLDGMIHLDDDSVALEVGMRHRAEVISARPHFIDHLVSLFSIMKDANNEVDGCLVLSIFLNKG